MDYMKDLQEMQKKMYESFQNMYSTDEERAEAKGLEDFFKFQQEGLDMFMKNMKDYGEKTQSINPFNMDYMGKIQKDYMEGLRDFNKNAGFKPYDLGESGFNQMFNMYRDMYSKYDFLESFNKNTQGIMEKAYEANKFYIELYEFWKELMDRYGKMAADNYGQLEEFIRKNSSLGQELILKSIPEDYRVFFQEPQELAEKYLDASSAFYKPWGDEINNLRDLFLRASLDNDVDKLTEFFRLWKEKYDESYGRIFKAPGLGVNKGIVELQNKAFDKFVDLYIVAFELSSKLSLVQKEAFEAIINEYIELARKGEEMKGYQAFFDFWSKGMDTRLVDYFGSQEFSKLIGRFSESIMDYKIALDRLVEAYLEDTPLVTKGQLDSMIKKIYDLQKEVKDLRREVELLKGQ